MPPWKSSTRLCRVRFCPERIVGFVIRIERLAPGIELANSLETELFGAASDLVAGQFAKLRLDDAKADEDVRMVLDRASDNVVRDRLATGRGDIRGIQQHRHHPAFAVLVSECRERHWLALRASKVGGHLSRAWSHGLDEFLGLWMNVNVDAHDIR